MSNVEKVQVWLYKCQTCGKLYQAEYVAEVCCKAYHCEDCGMESEKYLTVCSSCQEKRIFNRATKMTIEEYYEKYPNNMVVFGDDFYADVEEGLTYLFDNEIPFPNYCFGTSEQRMYVDADNALEQTEEDSDCEDLEFSEKAREELIDFVKQWNEKYQQKYYYEDKTIAILIPEDLKKQYSE